MFGHSWRLTALMRGLVPPHPCGPQSASGAEAADIPIGYGSGSKDEQARRANWTGLNSDRSERPVRGKVIREQLDPALWLSLVSSSDAEWRGVVAAQSLSKVLIGRPTLLPNAKR